MSMTILFTVALQIGAAPSAPAPKPAPPAASNEDADAAALSSAATDLRYYDFKTGDTLTGEVLSPDGQNLRSRANVRHASLLEIRGHFLPELIQLAMDL